MAKLLQGMNVVLSVFMPPDYVSNFTFPLHAGRTTSVQVTRVQIFARGYIVKLPRVSEPPHVSI